MQIFVFLLSLFFSAAVFASSICTAQLGSHNFTGTNDSCAASISNAYDAFRWYDHKSDNTKMEGFNCVAKPDCTSQNVKSGYPSDVQASCVTINSIKYAWGKLVRPKSSAAPCDPGYVRNSACNCVLACPPGEVTEGPLYYELESENDETSMSGWRCIARETWHCESTFESFSYHQRMVEGLKKFFVMGSWSATGEMCTPSPDDAVKGESSLPADSCGEGYQPWMNPGTGKIECLELPDEEPDDPETPTNPTNPPSTPIDQMTRVQCTQTQCLRWNYIIQKCERDNACIPDPTDPGPTNPGPTNPGPTNPGPTNPGPTNPGPTNPGPTNPGPTNPGPTDPGPTDPGPTDPGPTNPGPTNPGPTNPGPTNPGPTNPGPTDPDPDGSGDGDGECGGPDQPKCDVIVDVSDADEGVSVLLETINDTFQQLEDAFVATKDAVFNFEFEPPSWLTSFSFKPAQIACSPLPIGANIPGIGLQTSSIDICEHATFLQQLVFLLMSIAVAVSVFRSFVDSRV